MQLTAPVAECTLPSWVKKNAGPMNPICFKRHLSLESGRELEGLDAWHGLYWPSEVAFWEMESHGFEKVMATLKI